VKLSFRLVERQRPERIERLFRQFIDSQLPRTVYARITRLSSADPVVVDRHLPVFHAASVAYKRGFGRKPVYLRSGGSIPIVHALQNVLQLPPVIMGFGLPTDQVHGPNEHFHLSQLRRGIITSIVMMNNTISNQCTSTLEIDHPFDLQ
jgi:acetylornithine deacetylase/succinyl-diaminopimelate desuccinylase-like protein